MPAETVGQIGLDLVLNSQAFHRQLGGITGIAKKAAGLLGGIFTVGGIVSFTKKCLELGSDLNEVQNVVDVTFGSMSADVNAWAKDAMTSFGLSEKCAKDYVGTLGAMSKAFGFSTEKAYEQATTLAGLSADVASFYNLTGDEAFTKLKAVYTGETEGLKSLGVVMTQAALDEYALANGWGKVTAKMTEAEKVELRLAYVTNALSGASGDFVRTSDGWANQTKVLSLRFDALKASLGQGFINILTPAVRLLNEFVARLQVAAEAFRDFTAAVFGDAGGSATEQSAQAAGELADNTSSAAASANAYKKSLIGIDTLNKLGDTGASGGTAAAVSSGGVFSEKQGSKPAKEANTFLDVIKKKLREIADFTGLTRLWENFRKGFDRINLSGIVSNVKGIFDKIVKIGKNTFGSFIGYFQSVLGFIGTSWGVVSAVFGKGIELITGAIDSFLGANGGKIEDFFNNLFTTGSGFFDLFSGIIEDFFANVSAWWESDGAPIWDGIMGVFNDVGGIVLDVFNNNIFPIFDTLKTTIAELWAQNILPLWTKFESFISRLWELILGVWNEVIKPFVDWVVKNIVPMIQRAIQNVIAVIQTIITVITDVAGGIYDTLSGLIDFILGVFTGDWERAWNGIKEFFGGIWEAIWGIVKGIINLMIDAINGLWSGVVGVIQGIANGVGELAKAIGNLFGQEWGWEVNWADVPKIPKLASGGYVAANTPQLAVVGDNRREGEIIAPESKIAEAVAAGIAAAQPALGDGTVTIPISLELDGEALASAIATIQLRELMRGNGS